MKRKREESAADGYVSTWLRAKLLRSSFFSPHMERKQMLSAAVLLTFYRLIESRIVITFQVLYLIVAAAALAVCSASAMQRLSHTEQTAPPEIPALTLLVFPKNL